MATEFSELNDRQKTAVLRLLRARPLATAHPPVRKERRVEPLPPQAAQAKTITELFGYWVAAAPHAPALTDAGGIYDYQRLDSLSKRLSRAITLHGVVPNEPVAVCAGRGLGSVLSFLATARTRTIFLPLDPSNPPALNRAIAEQAGARLILTTAENRSTFEGLSCPIFPLDDARRLLELDEHFTAPHGDARPGDVAYLMHTSGTTGRPKGVPVSHANYLAFVFGIFAAYRPDTADRVLQFANQSFDIYMEELALSLLRGATLVIGDRELQCGADAFWSFIEQQRISIVSLPTAFWHLLVDGMRQEPPSCLRLCIVGGEALSVSHLRRWNQHTVPVFNTYGPTETTCVATVFDCRQLRDDADAVPIGRPLSNTKTFLLDEDLHPVRTGETGGLYLAGASVVEGYYKVPPDENRSFIRDSAFAPVLYQTGDLACLGADGELYYRGRIDEQIKIRGFRVQPQVVVEALHTLRRIAEAAVVAAKSDANGQNELFAFIAPSELLEDPSALLTEANNHLLGALPEYMLPKRIVILSALPKTARGKIDREALRALARQGS